MRWILILLMLLPGGLKSQDTWINEFHYDNVGTDTLEFVEVLSRDTINNLYLHLYNGVNGSPYDSVWLDTLSYQATGDGLRLWSWYPHDIQNGAPDGIVLAYGDSVVEALSWEGSFTGAAGIAAGIEFLNIGRSQAGTLPSGYTLQRTGTGSRPIHFSWELISPESPLAVNNGQVISDAPLILPDTDTLVFSQTPVGEHSAPSSFSFYAVNITAPVTIYLPPGFEAALSSDFSDIYSLSRPLILHPDTDWISRTNIHVRFSPSESKNYNDAIYLESVEAGTAAIRVIGTEGLPALPAAWINEFHYDNEGVDTLEFVEVVLRYSERYSAANLTLHLYNGTNGKPYREFDLRDAWPGEKYDGGYQLFVFQIEGIQNGPSDGFGLAYNQFPLHFISYEGSFRGTEGPFAGRLTDPVHAVEDGLTPALSSIQLIGEGKHPDAFEWMLTPGTNTMGKVNAEQVLPLRLLSYSLSEGPQPELRWRTSSEDGILGYIIEATTGDGLDSLAFLYATPSSNTYSEYRFHPNLALQPSYLSVSQISLDGYKSVLFNIPFKSHPVAGKPRLLSSIGTMAILLPDTWLGGELEIHLFTADGKRVMYYEGKALNNYISLSGIMPGIKTGFYVLECIKDRTEPAILRLLYIAE